MNDVDYDKIKNNLCKDRGGNMKFKNKAITLLAGIAVGVAVFSTETANASGISLILKRNAYIYNKNGHRSWLPLTLVYDGTHRKKIFKVRMEYKGNTEKIKGTKYINGKKYYKVAKNRYMKASDFTWNLFATKDGGAPLHKSPTSPSTDEDGVIGGWQIKIREKVNGYDGYVWYRIRKGEWVSSKDTSIPRKAKGAIPPVDTQKDTNTFSTDSQNSVKNETKIPQVTVPAKQHDNQTKAVDKAQYHGNVADFMDWLSQNSELSDAQKSSAMNAAEIIRGGGDAPSWYSTYVDINDVKDAASADNFAKTLDYYGRTNQIRTGKGIPAMKVSFRMIAKSIVSVDYQKRGGLEHSSYGGFENLASSQDPINAWMREEANWKYNVGINSSLADQEYKGPSGYPFYGGNGYRVAGHYLNLVNINLKSMGYAYLMRESGKNAVAYNGSFSSGDISVDEFVSLARQWLNMVKD